MAVGDRVLALVGSGGFATDVVVRPSTMQVHRIPDEMPFDEAAAFDMTYGTGIHGLVRRGGLRAGESVLVLGAAGGCGSAAVQIAKAAGATVIAVAGGEEKCALATALGADAVIDHRSTPSLSTAVKELTEGRGVDVVFDTVGGADAREQLRSLAWNGRYLVVGFAAGEIPMVKANQMILKGVSMVGVAYGMSAIIDPAANQEDFAQLFDWYRAGLVTPAIGHRFALTDAADAMRVRLRAPRPRQGRDRDAGMSRVAIVTGGASGIGRATAELLAARRGPSRGLRSERRAVRRCE